MIAFAKWFVLVTAVLAVIILVSLLVWGIGLLILDLIRWVKREK